MFTVISLLNHTCLMTCWNLTVPSESISTKYARVLWQISFVYSQAENNDFYAAVCKSRLNAQYAIPLRDWPDVRVGLV